MAEIVEARAPKISIPYDKLAEFCRRWQITEFALFGSVLRDDFRPDSDVDVLVTFEPKARWTLFDWVDIQEELRAIFGREVDLVTHVTQLQSSRATIKCWYDTRPARPV